MTDNADPEPGAKPGTRPPRRITVGAVVRAAGSTAALVAIYYLLLLTRTAAWAAVTMLAAGLVALIAMVAFSEPRTRTNALYFTVTVSSTVGFGDVTARTEAARRVVTAR